MKELGNMSCEERRGMCGLDKGGLQGYEFSKSQMAVDKDLYSGWHRVQTKTCMGDYRI